MSEIAGAASGSEPIQASTPSPPAPLCQDEASGGAAPCGLVAFAWPLGLAGIAALLAVLACLRLSVAESLERLAWLVTLAAGLITGLELSRRRPTIAFVLLGVTALMGAILLVMEVATRPVIASAFSGLCVGSFAIARKRRARLRALVVAAGVDAVVAIGILTDAYGVPAAVLLLGPAVALIDAVAGGARARFDALAARYPEAATRGAWAAVALGQVFVGTPWPPAMPTGGLDPSWELALHDAFARGLRFGHDVVFTYGPWGFVDTDTYDPRTLPTLLLVRGLISLSLAHLLWTLGRRSGLHPVQILGWSLAIGGLLILGEPGTTYVLPLVFVLAYGALPPGPAVAIAALLGLCVLTKTSHGIAIGVAIAGLTVVDLTNRRLPLAVLGSGLGVVVAWSLAGQRWSDGPAFLGLGIELATAYGDAMSSTGPRFLETGLELAALLAACAWLGWLGAPWTRGRDRGSWLVAGTMGALAALLVKASTTRDDLGHNLVGLSSGAAACLVLLPRSLAVSGARSWIPAAVVGMLFLLGLARLDARHPVATLAAHVVRLLRHLPLEGSQVLAGRREAALARIRDEVPLPPTRGSVDMFPCELAVPLAHGLELAPRPIWQSYAAFTPTLATRNADHVEARGPGTFFVRFGPIDDHLATSEDGPLWRVWLRHYDLAGRERETLVLQRRAHPRAESTRPDLDAAALGWGEWFTVGPGLIWARADVSLTAIGRLARVAWKVPHVIVSVETAAGEVLRHRLVPGAAAAGFLISPHVASIADIEGLLAGREVEPRRRVVRARLDVDGPAATGALFYEPTVRLNLAGVQCP